MVILEQTYQLTTVWIFNQKQSCVEKIERNNECSVVIELMFKRQIRISKQVEIIWRNEMKQTKSYKNERKSHRQMLNSIRFYFKMRMNAKWSPLRLKCRKSFNRKKSKRDEMKQIPFFQFVTFQRVFFALCFSCICHLPFRQCVWVYERRDSFFFLFLLFCLFNSCNDCVASATRTNIALNIVSFCSLFFIIW